VSLDPEVRRGGGLPFGMVCSRWVCDPRYSANARTLYGILVTYSDTHSRDTGRGKPYRKELAARLGVSMSTLDRVLAEMETAGLVTVERRTDPTNPRLNDANLYVLHDAEAWNGSWVDPLPPGVKAADVAKAAAEARRESSREVGGGVTGEATLGVTGEGRVASPVTPNVYNPVQNPDRDVPDGRRPSAGSKGSRSGGSAASGKTSTKQAGGKGVETFLRGLPAPLSDLVPEWLPAVLKEAARNALAADTPAARTPEQVVAYRLMPKWDRHYGSQAAAGPLHKPVGVLVAMLHRDAECGDHRCDERTNVDTGEPCRSCEVRAEERQAAPVVQDVPEPRPVVVVPLQTCDGCERAFRAPEPGLCRGCRTAA